MAGLMRHFFCLGILFCAFTTVASAFDDKPLYLTFEEKTENILEIQKYTINKTGNGYQLTIEQDESVITLSLDDKLHTYREHYRSKRTDDEIFVNLKDGELLFSGVIENEECKDEEKISDLPWFGSKILLKDFVLSGEDEIKFYMTRPEELKSVRLKAIKEGGESIDVAGKQVDAIRVKFTVDDFRAFFWSSTFWFRSADGILVKTQEVRGGPGTPTTYATLVEESTGQGLAEELKGQKEARAEVVSMP